MTFGGFSKFYSTLRTAKLSIATQAATKFYKKKRVVDLKVRMRSRFMAAQNMF